MVFYIVFSCTPCLFLFLVVLGIKHIVLYMAGKCYILERHPHTLGVYVVYEYVCGVFRCMLEIMHVENSI